MWSLFITAQGAFQYQGLFTITKKTIWWTEHFSFWHTQAGLSFVISDFCHFDIIGANMDYDFANASAHCLRGGTLGNGTTNGAGESQKQEVWKLGALPVTWQLKINKLANAISSRLAIKSVA